MRLKRLVVAVVLLLSACGRGGVTPSPSTPSVTPPTPSPSPVVPTLIDSSFTDAKGAARAVGMKAIVGAREFSSKPMGTVLERVRAGSLATAGGEIEVVVSVFPKVPSLVGLSVAKARARLAPVSLRLGPITRGASTEEKGVVIGQGIRHGKRVPAERQVGLVVVGPHVCGSPLDPWCYSVTSGGSLIYGPPFALCSWIDCIPSFWSSTNGFVIQCAHGEFSHSGGVSGSCSSHGGNWRPLYR